MPADPVAIMAALLKTPPPPPGHPATRKKAPKVQKRNAKKAR
jgi:hypothetical protein